MKSEEKGNNIFSKKMISIIITVAICLMFMASFITFVSRLVEYNEIQKRKEELKLEIFSCKEDIEELEYWIGAPMDDNYIIKFAREKLELYRADEVVFTNDQKN